MKYIFKSIIVLSFIFIFSCSEIGKIEYLDVYYLPNGTTVQVPVSCDLLYKDAMDIIQTDRLEDHKFLLEFEDLFYKYEADTNDTSSIQDVRIRCMIHFKNGQVDTLCLGESFGTYLNNQKQKDLQKLLLLLKKELDYENSYKKVGFPVE